jgi:hypothetical protein
MLVVFNGAPQAMKPIRRIYVTQYNHTWSLTPEAWRKAVEAAVANKNFHWDEFGKCLSRPVSKWEKQFNTLDWHKEDWIDQLETLRNEHDRHR